MKRFSNNVVSGSEKRSRRDDENQEFIPLTVLDLNQQQTPVQQENCDEDGVPRWVHEQAVELEERQQHQTTSNNVMNDLARIDALVDGHIRSRANVGHEEEEDSLDRWLNITADGPEEDEEPCQRKGIEWEPAALMVQPIRVTGVVPRERHATAVRRSAPAIAPLAYRRASSAAAAAGLRPASTGAPSPTTSARSPATSRAPRSPLARSASPSGAGVWRQGRLTTATPPSTVASIARDPTACHRHALPQVGDAALQHLGVVATSNAAQQQQIFLLLFILLYLSAFAVIARFRRRSTEDYYSIDEEEATVFKISLWLCTFSLAVSLGAALLLPISILSNEILALYPSSYYVQWLNHSLVQGMWCNIFLFSNLSLFAFLPFAYLFTESEGFPGYRKGIMARVHETFVILMLLGVTVLGMTYVIASFFEDQHSTIMVMFNLGSYYLPFLYSCISFIGALILLLCTPLGFERLFAVVGNMLVKPQFLRDLEVEFHVALLEEHTLEQRLARTRASGGRGYLCPAPMSPAGALADEPPYVGLQNGELQAGIELRLADVRQHRRYLEELCKTSSLQRNVLYPASMLLLVALTALAVFMVAQNTLGLLIGIKALPLSQEDFILGLRPLSQLGPAGALLEIALICYLVATSSVGVYTLPGLRRVKPRRARTPFTHVVANCALLLVLSSALPLLARILGFTNFDLLGDFGKIRWLGNMEIVLLYNVGFGGCAALCLANRFTAKVRMELWSWFCSLLGIFESKEPLAQEKHRIRNASISSAGLKEE